MRSADSAIQVTDEGIIPMKTHGQISHIAIPPRPVTAGGAHAAPRTGQAAQVVRGAVVLALVLGSLGAAEAGSLGLGSTSHVRVHQVVSHVRPSTNGRHRHVVHGLTGPWMT
jgi:hypothetical protein